MINILQKLISYICTPIQSWFYTLITPAPCDPPATCDPPPYANIHASTDICINN